MIHRVCVSIGTVGRYAFHLPSISHAQASVNSCFFSAYPIALIGKADSQEDAPPLFPLLLLGVVTQGSFPPKVHHGCFRIFLLSILLFFVCLVYCWSEGL